MQPESKLLSLVRDLGRGVSSLPTCASSGDATVWTCIFLFCGFWGQFLARKVGQHAFEILMEPHLKTRWEDGIYYFHKISLQNLFLYFCSKTPLTSLDSM